MASSAVLLDSSFVVAFHNNRDVHHAAAAGVMDEIQSGRFGRVLLLEYVVLEVLTVLGARRGHETASRVALTLLGAREVEFVPCSDHFAASLETFLGQRSGSLSFVDAAIVAVARMHSGSRVATFDRDFADLEGVTVVPA